MSWDIILFSSKQKIESIEKLDETQFEPIAFYRVLESSFDKVNVNDKHREIVGIDFTIDFFSDNEKSSNFMLQLYGENALYAIIELAKKHKWQIYDSGINEMIDLKSPEKNGFKNHQKYIERTLKLG